MYFYFKLIWGKFVKAMYKNKIMNTNLCIKNTNLCIKDTTWNWLIATLHENSY